MSAAGLQALLRFLSQDAKVPLASAMTKVKDLQSANLNTPEQLAKSKLADIVAIFPDEKVAKQIFSAAKRVAKKRAAGDEVAPSPKKKRNNDSLFSQDVVSPTDLEASLVLPISKLDERGLSDCAVFTNRAPLVLAFVVTLLKYTMPEQPLSSRLSLAQGYVSTTSRARAVNLGIESGTSAEEEGFGEGQPSVTIMGKSLRVLRRWGYEWRSESPDADVVHSTQEASKAEDDTSKDAANPAVDIASEEPALWAIDLESLKKSNTAGPIVVTGQSGNHSGLPIYTPQSARAYLCKAFASVPSLEQNAAQVKGTNTVADKEAHLGEVLTALDIVYQSWISTLNAHELDKRTWGWYVRVRPDVESGVAGWGGKNVVKIADILALALKNNIEQETDVIPQK
nr:hypothetical protein CFP56_21790 [Quercus suber]